MQGPGLPCVHCGLCLDTCPTYRVLGTEADSPRGRIWIMEAVRTGALSLDREASAHLDGCLGCLACESACPSGVSFHERIEEVRPRLVHPLGTRLWRRIVAATSKSPRLLRTALVAAHVLDSLGLEGLRRRTPGLGVLPRRRAGSPSPLRSAIARSRICAPTQPRARAAILVGCVGDALRPTITRAAVEALHANDVAVVDVAEQVCCGALALHGGENQRARELARTNAGVFARDDIDFVVTTAAGCCAMMKDYARVVADDARARAVAERTRDVCELLAELGMREPERPYDAVAPVVYHDACHLLHAAKVTDGPRRVVAAAVGSSPRDLGENEICCGSAGSYNLEHPAIAGVLGRRKAELVRASGARSVAVANIGCIAQIERALALDGGAVPVFHPIELLAEAYVRESNRRAAA